MHSSVRDKAIQEIKGRVLERIGSDPDAIFRVLADSLYHEHQRLKNDREAPRYAEDKAFWSKVRKELGQGDPGRRRVLLEEAVDRYADEIAGEINPMAYRLVSRVVPHMLSAILNPPLPHRILKKGDGGFPSIERNIRIEGHVDSLCRLRDRGRIILAPTHLSHMDSVVVGYVLSTLGLPPFLYGAGLNLFTNPLLSASMNNLGAYKVDRKKKHKLYKDVLKEYCTVTLEYGYDNLFFPGGTRSRSGAIETRLKMGLLGCGLKAYQNNLRNKKTQPKIFVVPATLSYHIVLEAETLIEDYLQEAGKSQYIIEYDESRQLNRVWKFMRDLIRLDGRIYCSFGRPLDPFGNLVDDEGISHDHRGRPIDISKYVIRRGELTVDDQRDREYTINVAQGILESYRQENVVLSTNILTRALWTILLERTEDRNTFKLLRGALTEPRVATASVLKRLAMLRDEVVALAEAGRLRIEKALRNASPISIMNDAMKHLSSYHKVVVIAREGDHLIPKDFDLLFYYSNRLDGYGLE